MNKAALGKAIGAVWITAAIGVGALVVVVQKPATTHASSFEHPHRQVAVYDEPVSVDLPTGAFVPPPPSATAPPPPEPPVVMRGAKIIVEQPAVEPQPIAHSQAN